MTNPAHTPRPLDGITVVSFEHAIAAPFCTRQLADLGARVIKIERPGVGDFARGYDNRVRGLSSHFVWTNRSKESLTLDLKQDDATQVLDSLLAKADVLVQNLAPGAAARMGLSFEALHERMSAQAPALGKKGRDYLRLFLSGAAQEIPDSQRRITIPAALREYAHLDRELTVIGAGTRAEIWDTEAWNTYYSATEAEFSDADLAALCAAMRDTLVALAQEQQAQIDRLLCHGVAFLINVLADMRHYLKKIAEKQ